MCGCKGEEIRGEVMESFTGKSVSLNMDPEEMSHTYSITIQGAKYGLTQVQPI